MTAVLRAALLIAIDTLDLQYAFRRALLNGCARCGGPRDTASPYGGLLHCCSLCLHKMKLQRVYGPGDPRAPERRTW